MKKIYTIAAIAAATILAASCAKEEAPQKEGIIAHASLQPVEATKAIGEYSYNIVWEENDKIAVLDNANNKASFSLKEGAGSTTGTFQQEGSDVLTAPLSAYYPASVVAEDKSLVWPATQADVKNISNVPMTAESSTATGDVNFAFKHLGSVLQLVLTAKNGTINVKQIDITADQGLSGAFAVEDGTAVISSTGTTITTGDISDKNIKLSATASYLNFAVPSGSFTNFKITITDINDKTYFLSAANLTLNRAMVNKVTFAMDAKSDSVFEVEVNGHTVKIVYSSAEGIEDDVWIKNVEVVNNSVVVSAQSFFDKHLKCTMPGGELCTSQSRTTYKDSTDDTISRFAYTFTISDISENTTATIGYASPVSIAVTPDKGGSVEIKGGELYEGETVTLKAIPAYEYGFDAWLDGDGDPLTCEEETYSSPVRLSSDGMRVRFKENLVLGGEFSVAADKKVRFTRGNLYYDDNWLSIEQHQYDYNSSQWTSSTAHVSHFMWCNKLSKATSQQYNNTLWDNETPFFTEFDGLLVSGISFSDYKCRTLKTEEWQYLFSYNASEQGGKNYDNDIRRDKYKLGVTVCGKGNCIVLLPDDWTGGKIESSYDYVGWKHMEAAGAVCLPAAGYRDGDYGVTDVSRADSYGYYWSASSYGDNAAFDLSFGSDDVLPDGYATRGQAYAVRLVIECQSDPSAE